MKVASKALNLQPDVEVSDIICGVASFGNVYGDVSFAEKQELVKYALEHGITSFDTSGFYGGGMSESVLGDCLQSVPRESVRICTKIGRSTSGSGNGGGGGFNFTAASLEQQFQGSLDRQKVDYVDCLALHDIEFGNQRDVLEEAIPFLQRMKAIGKCHAIGVTGYPHGLQHDIVVTQHEKGQPLDYIVSYNHCTLQNTSVKALRQKLAYTNIDVFEASPLGLGFFAEGPLQPWLSFPPQMQRVRKESLDLCAQSKTTLSKVGLQYHFQQNAPYRSIIGAKTVQELQETLAAYSEPIIPAELLSAITSKYDALPHKGGKTDEEWRNHSGLPLEYQYEGHDEWTVTE